MISLVEHLCLQHIKYTGQGIEEWNKDEDINLGECNKSEK